MKDLNVAVIKGGWSHETNEIVTYKEIAQAVKENGWNVSIHDVTNENFVKILLKQSQMLLSLLIKALMERMEKYRA